ncbi:DUF1566 domain-containing protein [Saccharophagus sp. K07]|jgi:hypothetical protein|uniref:Lcl C-terminal domain-containing protein n=1 Tax=Saccharophagus sp. K07 TaxID=2283636 RepID=UPI001651F138|nr:DUF1566 domain-containing protein [Saccharophagus sp. K07]MBC6906340.1 DUF1566 domain-containing protein [Saccharophagus sp. K07]
MNKSVLLRPVWPLALALLWGCNGNDGTSGGSNPPEDNHDHHKDYPVVGQLNDTGLVLCAGPETTEQPCPQAELPGQDAEYGRDLAAAQGTLSKTGGGVAGFDWTKLDSTGAPLAIQDGSWDPAGTEAEGTRWSCVRDNVTGLIWEIKESDPSHPRYTGHTYRWVLDGDEYNGAFPDQSSSGTCGTDSCDTQSFVNWVNQNSLCGFSDWRLPSVAELSSIVVMSNALPAVDTAYFPDVKEPRFFTNQSLARDPSRAWYIYFSDGSASFTNKGDASHVRLVRGGQQ